MALYIRDDTVNELASQLAQTTGKTKTEAVRVALEARLREVRTPETLHERVARIQAQVHAWGAGRARRRRLRNTSGSWTSCRVTFDLC